MHVASSGFPRCSRLFCSLPKFRKVPSKYKSLALQQAQEAITDYLHTTKSLPYAYAEHIGKNSTVSLHNLISKLDFSVPNFARSLRKHLSYHPINEFQFFFESIGIPYEEVGRHLPLKKFFFSEDPVFLDAACALSGFGFPWNELGKLYKEENLIFNQSSEEITCRLKKFKAYGFSTSAVVGICLAFPHALHGGSELNEQIGSLFVNLRKALLDFDSENCLEDNVDSWYNMCRKIRVFHDMGLKKQEAWELIGMRKQILIEYSEEVLVRKSEYFCRFGGRKMEAGLLLLQRPEILDFDLETPVISMMGLLKHFRLSEDTLEYVAQKYPYVFGRNKMGNLPGAMRALNLHEWFLDKMKNGGHHLLPNYSLGDPDEDLDEEYIECLKVIESSRTPTHTMNKLDFLHRIGFGQNALTVKVLKDAHGTCSELQARFDSLLGCDIQFSRICTLIRLAPKILNQKPQSIEKKLRFLCGEMNSSLDYLDVFPAFLCYDLENRIKPRFRLQKWLVEKGLCEINYSISSVVATSEKAFVARLYGIHPAVPKQWFECFSVKKSTRT